MIAALILGSYLAVGLTVGLVAAYKIRLDQRLAGHHPDWEEPGAAFVALTTGWLLLGIGWCIYQLIVQIGRGIDTAVEAEVEERHARDQDADP